MKNELLEQVLEVAEAAGRAAMEHYGGDGPVEYKEDNSPLTLADKAAHFVIVNALQVLDPWLPVLSEESAKEEISERKSWDDF
ncbi:MAG: 3'(2'),5'-bisphosphate nucleotidase CysQ, partial [Planctomycetota bacterium]|nr:3'(2'),5'-bisphosphate nucleotidase CysQ [Planctomycetota bacterium]